MFKTWKDSRGEAEIANMQDRAKKACESAAYALTHHELWSKVRWTSGEGHSGRGDYLGYSVYGELGHYKVEIEAGYWGHGGVRWSARFMSGSWTFACNGGNITPEGALAVCMKDMDEAGAFQSRLFHAFW